MCSSNHLEKNLDLLSHKDPELANYLSCVKVPQTVQVLKSKSHLPTLKYIDQRGEASFLHCPKDPLQEALRLLNGYSFAKMDATVLFGFGLGYLAKEIVRKKHPHHLLCIVEGLPELFKTALVHMDLTEILMDDNTHFFVGEYIERLAEDFKPIQVKSLSGNVRKLALPGFVKLYNGVYDEVEKILHNCITSTRISFNNFLRQKDLCLANLFDNMPMIAESAAADDLKDLLAGCPVIVVAAGPSLSCEIEILKKNVGRYFTICVDTALKPLVKNGIKPDLTVTCDPISANAEKISGLSTNDMAGIPLVFRADAQPAFVRRFSGRKFVAMADTSVAKWLLKAGLGISYLSRFQTVSHLGLLIALLMGADPVIFVGLDLAFPQNRHHAMGCTAPWKLNPDKMVLSWIPNNNGGLVKSIPSFMSMIHMFETEIRRSRTRFINVSKHGARIEGAEYMSLKEVMAQFAENDSQKKILDFRDLLSEHRHVDTVELKRKFLQALTWMLSETQGLSEICKKTRKVMEFTTSETNASDRLLVLQQNAFNHKPYLNIISDYMPRYLLSFHTIPKLGIPMVNPQQDESWKEQLFLFFEELVAAVSLIETHGSSALRRIRRDLGVENAKLKAFIT